VDITPQEYQPRLDEAVQPNMQQLALHKHGDDWGLDLVIGCKDGCRLYIYIGTQTPSHVVEAHGSSVDV